MKRIQIFLTAFLIAIVLVYIWFRNIQLNQFLFIHDEYLLLSLRDSLNAFYIHNAANLGSSSTIETIVTFFDRAFYLFTYLFSNNVHFTQIIFYILKIFLIIVLPFFGFKKLANIYKANLGTVIIFSISLWFSFNTFTLTYWNTTAFSLTALICYSLAPLALYYYHKSIFEKANINSRFFAIILLFLMSFAFYIFAAFIFLLIIYTLIYLIAFKIKPQLVLEQLLILGLMYFPFLAIDLIIPYEMFTNKVLAMNFSGNEAYANLDGGILYQLLMWYSWPIYVNWEPRNIFTFAWYFKAAPSVVAPFILYGLIFFSIIGKKVKKIAIVFLSLFLILLLFIKGAQEPLGGIYLFLIKHVYLFNVFRSPDSKFGFGIVLIIAILLILAASRYGKKIVLFCLFLVIIIQNLPLLTGVAIVGENTTNSSDRVISVTKDYKELADYLNSHTLPYGYILPFQSDVFTYFRLSNKETHLGQDLLPKLLVNPLVYVSKGVSINSQTYKLLSEITNFNNLSELNKFPIRYFVVRKDVISNKQDIKLFSKLANISKLVFENNLFIVYKFTNGVPIVQSLSMNSKMINQVYYKLEFRKINKNQGLYFNQSFSNNWKLYSVSGSLSGFLDEISYFWRRPLFDSTHVLQNGYSNSWVISPEFIKNNLNPRDYVVNPDGTINFTLTLYYKPQSLFYNGMLISFLYLTMLILILGYVSFVGKKKLAK